MAHKKGVGSSKNGRESESKRLGVKLFGGEFAKAGKIIIRQRGTEHHPGENTFMGKDHTIHAAIDGIVVFTKTKNNRSFISVKSIGSPVVEPVVKPAVTTVVQPAATPAAEITETAVVAAPEAEVAAPEVASPEADTKKPKAAAKPKAAKKAEPVADIVEATEKPAKTKAKKEE
jgi:large subunit ribosomal protein L27